MAINFCKGWMGSRNGGVDGDVVFKFLELGRCRLSTFLLAERYDGEEEFKQSDIGLQCFVVMESVESIA